MSKENFPKKVLAPTHCWSAEALKVALKVKQRMSLLLSLKESALFNM